MKMTYGEFKNQLSNKGYGERGIVHLFRAFKKMDNESRLWLLGWLLFNRVPEKEIEGVTAGYLIHGLGYKPINAFIILDWLKTDPNAAKYFLQNTHEDVIIGEEAIAEIAKIMGLQPSSPLDEPPNGEALEAEMEDDD